MVLMVKMLIVHCCLDTYIDVVSDHREVIIQTCMSSPMRRVKPLPQGRSCRATTGGFSDQLIAARLNISRLIFKGVREPKTSVFYLWTR